MKTKHAQSFDADERRLYLGVSEIAAVMGLDRWRTPLDVYNEKMGLSAPFEGNAHTERGNRLEAIAADYYTETSGHALRRKSEALYHPVHACIRGHIDRTVVGEKRIVEIKCPSIAAFRKYQREGLPESMVVQLQVYLGLSGCPVGTWLVFAADAWEMAVFDIEFSPEIYNAAITAGAEFWNNHVLQQIPPDPDAAKSDLKIEKAGTVTFRSDPGFESAANLVREAWQLAKDADELKELAKQAMTDAVEGEFGVYEGAGVRVYYTQSEGRKSFDKKALAAAHPEIDLSAFEKVGAAFTTFKPYFIGGE